MSQGKIRVILPIIFLLLVMSVMGCGGDDKYVKIVKTGTMNMEPNIQIGKAFDNFFSNPKWHSYTEGRKDLRHIVEFTGNCRWNNSPAKCTIHFIITSDTEFQFQWVAINDIQMDNEDGLAILHKALTNRDY